MGSVQIRSDVCVIGGGPAGSIIAAQLSRLGFATALVEAERFPRPHIGESLFPGDPPAARSCRRAQQAVRTRSGFLRPGPGHRPLGWPSSSRADPAEPRGFQVDRGAFDELLLASAAHAGVRVVQPARALRPVHAGPRDWKVAAVSSSGRTQIEASFLIDACGRRGILRAKKRRLSAPTVALHAYWRDVGLAGHETRVEEAGCGSTWFSRPAPLPGGLWNVTAFVSPVALRCIGEPGAAYRSLLARSELLSGILAGKPATPVHACAQRADPGRRARWPGLAQGR